MRKISIILPLSALLVFTAAGLISEAAFAGVSPGCSPDYPMRYWVRDGSGNYVIQDQCFAIVMQGQGCSGGYPPRIIPWGDNNADSQVVCLVDAPAGNLAGQVAQGNPNSNQNGGRQPLNPNTNQCDLASIIGSDHASKYLSFMGKNSSADEILTEIKALPCGQAATLADKCCGNPASCMFSDPSSDPNAEDSTTWGQVIQLLSVAAVSVPAGSITDQCGRMKDVAYATSGIQAAMSWKCDSKIHDCKAQCADKLAAARSDYQKVDRVDTRSICRRELETIGYVKDALDSENNYCVSANNAQVALSRQVIASQMSGKFAAMCQNQAAAQQSAFANPDCTQPAQAVTPFCQYACNRPNAAQDPNCAAMLSALKNGNLAGFGANGAPNGAMGDAQSLYGGLPTPAENPQLAHPPTTDASSKGLAKTEGGGSSGGLGGGGGGGGGGSNGPAGKAGGGYDTSILRGIASGNGYSAGPHMASGSNSGFSGYGSGNNNVLGKPLNLKNYLPGGANGPKKNTFRGLASTIADIGPAHDDIFEKISNRFYQVCLRDGLYDCDNLKKMKRAVGGN